MNKTSQTEILQGDPMSVREFLTLALNMMILLEELSPDEVLKIRAAVTGFLNFCTNSEAALIDSAAVLAYSMHLKAISVQDTEHYCSQMYCLRRFFEWTSREDAYPDLFSELDSSLDK